MPQIDLLSFFPVVFYVIIGFLAFVFLLRTYFLPNLAIMMKVREKAARKLSFKISKISQNVSGISKNLSSKEGLHPSKEMMLNETRMYITSLLEYFNRLQK